MAVHTLQRHAELHPPQDWLVEWVHEEVLVPLVHGVQSSATFANSQITWLATVQLLVLMVPALPGRLEDQSCVILANSQVTLLGSVQLLLTLQQLSMRLSQRPLQSFRLELLTLQRRLLLLLDSVQDPKTYGSSEQKIKTSAYVTHSHAHVSPSLQKGKRLRCTFHSQLPFNGLMYARMLNVTLSLLSCQLLLVFVSL